MEAIIHQISRNRLKNNESRSVQKIYMENLTFFYLGYTLSVKMSLK